MTVQFDNKISLGHVISILTVLTACIMAYATLSARQDTGTTWNFNLHTCEQAVDHD